MIIIIIYILYNNTCYQTFRAEPSILLATLKFYGKLQMYAHSNFSLLYSYRDDCSSGFADSVH